MSDRRVVAVRPSGCLVAAIAEVARLPGAVAVDRGPDIAAPANHARIVVPPVTCC
jgi:hypothetical protein